MKVIVTGASGFVGQSLLKSCEEPHTLVPVKVRSNDGSLEKIDWQGVVAVIHLAGLAHQNGKIEAEDYLRANTDLTAQLAKKAKENKVGHFIFLSTIKVFGDGVSHIDNQTPTVPTDAYGLSKLKAENELLKLQSPDFRVTIFRPPLIVGAGAKGNLEKLMNHLKKNKWLPLGGIHNQRSMLSLNTLISALCESVSNPKPGVYALAEPKPLSTTDLISQIDEGLGHRSTRLFKLPTWLRGILRILRPALYQRLFGSLVIHDSVNFLKSGHDNALSLAINQMVHHHIIR